jgi:hypothetical protein
MAYRLPLQESIRVVPSAAKKQMLTITKGMDSTTWFGDDAWNGAKGKQFTVKMSKDNFALAKKTVPSTTEEFEVKLAGGRPIINFVINDYKFQFQESSKRAGAPDGGTTQQQELASLFMIKKALGTPSRIYKDVDDLKSDKKSFESLVKLYPDLETNTKWVEGLIAQQKTVGVKLKQGNYTEYNRDGGFMDFISKVVKTKFGISKKDNWNPADVWVIKNQASVERDILQAVEGQRPSIQELNAVMRRMWDDKRLKGISLKAVSGKIAKWEEVNVGAVLFTEANSPNVFELKEAMIKLDVKGGKFASQDSIVRIKEGTSIEYKFQIKMNSRNFSNLKFEPTQVGAGAARLGKVPLDMLKTMLRSDYNINFSNNNNEYPKTSSEFEKVEEYFAMKFNLLKSNGVKTNITSKEQFKENIKLVFKSEPDVANSKLMQIDFLYDIMSISKDERNKLLTDMVFLAMKKGQVFGPFGKLY